MKKLLIFLFIFSGISTLKAQEFPTVADIALMDKTWYLISDIGWKKIPNGPQIPVFPAGLKALDTKTIDISGYMVPIKAGMTYDKIMLSVLPSAQCQFCGMSGIPSMIEVFLNKPIPWSDEPLHLKGKVMLKVTYDYSAFFILTNADVIKD